MQTLVQALMETLKQTCRYCKFLAVGTSSSHVVEIELVEHTREQRSSTCPDLGPTFDLQFVMWASMGSRRGAR